MFNLRDKKDAVLGLLDEETTKSNKELLLAAGICTLVGIVIGIFIGKAATSKNTVKKYNKCYSYDFGEEPSEE
ncbi:MAG: hypothetical protein ACI4EN_06165 [Butyrivibrio sp.]